MKMIGNRSNPNGDESTPLNADGEPCGETNHHLNTNSNSLDGANEYDEHAATGHSDEARATSLLFDFSNNADLMMFGEGGTMRKKRKPNPDKEKYLAEPQYVTKRTSSGRLVKMKIINDFDYTSDQEKDGKRKKSA